MISKQSGDSAKLSEHIRRIPNISRVERAALIFYKNLYLKKGKVPIHPSVKSVAEGVDYCEWTTSKAIGRLVYLGLLKLVGNEKGGPGKSRIYIFMESAVIDAGPIPQKSRQKKTSNHVTATGLNHSEITGFNPVTATDSINYKREVPGLGISNPKTPSQGKSLSKSQPLGKGQLTEFVKPHHPTKRIAGTHFDITQWNHGGASCN